MPDSSSHGRFGRVAIRRLFLVSASLAIGTVIWFLLGDSDGLVAEEKLIPAAHAAVPAPAVVIAHVDGVPISEEDVLIDVAGELAALEQQRRQLLQTALEGRIAEQLLAAEAETLGTSVADLLSSEVDAKLDQVPEADLEARLVDLRAEQGAEIPDALVQETRRQLRLAAYIEELRTAAAVSVYDEPGV